MYPSRVLDQLRHGPAERNRTRHAKWRADTARTTSLS